MRSRIANASLSCLLVVASVVQLNSQADIRVDTTLVVIPASVTDAGNHFVLGLEKKDFALYEDGVEQKVTQFAGEDAPLSVGLLVDISGSMADKMALSREAVAQFMKTMKPGDEACLIEFGDKAKIAAEFPATSAAIEDKLSNVESQGLTALLDAVSLGIVAMKKSKNPRKALLIISDGGDNNSRYTAAEIKDLVRQADVEIYSMGVFDRFPLSLLTAAELSGPKLLSELSEQTGGRAFSASDSRGLPAIATRIGIELRNQYILAYSPVNHNKDGKYRRVKVDVKAQPGLPGFKSTLAAWLLRRDAIIRLPQ